MPGRPGMRASRCAGMRPSRLRAGHSCSNLTHRRAGGGTSIPSGRDGHGPCAMPCRGAHRAAPASCRQPRMDHRTCPGICEPHGCTVMALTAPATRHLRQSVPTRPCFVNPGFGAAARHTSPGRLGLVRRNRRAQRFSPARAAPSSRDKIAVPAGRPLRSRPKGCAAPGLRLIGITQGRDGRGLETQEIYHG